MSATSLLAVGAMGSISQMASGFGASSAANQEAKLQEQQGGIALSEAETNANLEAFKMTQQVQGQRLGYLANGVSLEGSPAEVLAASKNYAQTQVQSILNEGAAKYNLAQEEAAQTKNKGRAAMIAGISQGISSGASDVGSYEKITGKNPFTGKPAF